ncbi:hypothetical protein HS088_TW06G01108 [Tripterygium wilfordii]|uniref:Transcription and mRNA export factor ENY2 n=1 Tax=Tripterygium wilfordii TaxID=458696 RepID=A0A7J7DKN9_TRIWF|nr:hypothetical protein HS088_TW06G01108 [Tripterygium wilfordii]
MKMRRDGFVPNEHTFPCVLKAVCCIRSLESCQQVHSHVLKFGLIFDLHIVNGLVRGYLVSGDHKGARKVFDEFPERDLNLWTTLICGHVQNICADEALVLFNQMVEEGFEPNGATIASVLSACAQSGCLELGERIHAFMEEKGIEIGTILGTALVHMYAKNGSILKARRKSVNRPPTPESDAVEDQQQEPTLQEMLSIKLIESGEKERLMELLRERLIECGWKDEMKSLCRAYVKKKGRNNVTVDDLVHVITPKGRASVPNPVKAELLQRIRTFLMSAAL